jgi:single-strand DNA-binding protein
MAWSVNKAIVVGNVTRDPELRMIPSGQSVTGFGVATNRRWKNQTGEIQESTEFHDVVAWGKLAEIIQQIVKKGDKIFVEGRLQTRQWEAPDGTKRQRTEIIMENFVPLSPKGAAAEITEVKTEETPPMVEVPEKTEDQKPKKGKSRRSDVGIPTKASGNEKEEKKESGAIEEINLDDIPF